MNEVNGELIDYLDKRFNRIETSLDVMKEEMITKADRADLDRLRNSIDAYVKQGEDSKEEFASLSNQVDRHEKWIDKLAAKAKLKLQY